ncbi:uncharacterized protein LOC110893417 [Helianthus annuus]|uniref:uncharacterized protein LOC110893417 n=1 Tax=Helianthus annuus TaxID=4232 RepID=UPI000B8F127F|nr:uncharacterized protein LOC110893417 [Helianthus annuus]
MSGELKKEMFTAEDMYQKFQDKTGKRLGHGKAGFDKSKLRCYNCKNLGHFKRDCPLLKEGNSEATPAVKQITVEENKNNASPSTPKALVSEEINEAKEQVNKALMAKISSETSPKQFEKQTAGIPKGDNTVDKGLKSILTSVEPEKEKKCGQAEEHVSNEASEKGKEKVPAAAMKADSSKEKADKDLGHVPTFETCDREHCVSECHDLNYACCDDKVACKSPVFVPELKKNSFGKFLTEEIPEFIPSRTGVIDSEKSVSEDHGNEDSNFTASEDEQGSESSSEDQSTNDESSECSSSETIEDQDLESPNKDQSYNESSYEASEEQSSSEDNMSESSSDSDNDEKYSEDESRNKLQKWLRMLMEYIWHVDSGCSRHMTGLKELLKNFCFIDGDFVSFAGDEKGGKIVGVGDVVSEALTLENVNYVPELCYNLLSVSQVYDFSRFSWVYFLEAKSETAEVLKTFIPLIENVTKLKVKSIRSDNGSEFKNQTFISFCAEKGIHLQYSAARTPQQNGVAERKNRR